jgi:hypothetical protein
MYPISMNRWHRRLLDAPRRVPVVRWVEADFTVPVRSGPNARRPATARRRRSEGETCIQNRNRITTGQFVFDHTANPGLRYAVENITNFAA